MDIEYKNALIRCETDVDTVLQRLSDDEDMYELCLSMFLQDKSMDDFECAFKNNCWDDAFTAVHALKGVAGNMGFIPLFQAAAEMVILIRSGKTAEAKASCKQLKQRYEEISDIIRRYGKTTETT